LKQKVYVILQEYAVQAQLNLGNAAYFHLPITARSITRVQGIIMETNYGVELKAKRPTVAQHGTIA
jgi:hypothetical protein